MDAEAVQQGETLPVPVIPVCPVLTSGEIVKAEGDIAPYKNPVGRPTSYAPSMIEVVKHYISNCPDVVPSLVGLSMELGICEKTMRNWRILNPDEVDPNQFPRFAEFLDLCDKVMDLQHRTALNRGADDSWNSTIAKLVLSKHGYADKSETDNTHRFEVGPPVIH